MNGLLADIHLAGVRLGNPAQVSESEDEGHCVTEAVPAQLPDKAVYVRRVTDVVENAATSTGGSYSRLCHCSAKAFNDLLLDLGHIHSHQCHCWGRCRRFRIPLVVRVRPCLGCRVAFFPDVRFRGFGAAATGAVGRNALCIVRLLLLKVIWNVATEAVAADELGALACIFALVAVHVMDEGRTQRLQAWLHGRHGSGGLRAGGFAGE